MRHCRALDLVKEILKISTQEKGKTPLIDIQDAAGRTALYYAVLKGDEKMLNELLKLGANPNIQDIKQGKTPLHYAVYYKNKDMVAILLKYKAELDLKDSENEQGYKSGKAALHYAVDTTYDKNGNMLYPNIDLVKMLLKGGANPDIRDIRNRAPDNNMMATDEIKQLFKSFRSVDSKGKEQGIEKEREKEKEKEKLASFKNDSNSINKLREAVSKNKLADVEVLLKDNVNPNAADKDGMTVLHTASRMGYTRIVEALLNAGANPNMPFPLIT